jgi:energy-coupling factor transporter ATP-binding protein EcfA2
MSHARLLSVEVQRFKSYREATRLDLKPLTVLVGRNNSGKSTIVQALLLLKQTLESPRADVPLHLVGVVEALSVRELTHGWPETIGHNEGPVFTLTMESRLDLGRALRSTQNTSEKVLVERGGITGLRQRKTQDSALVRTTITLRFTRGRPSVRAVFCSTGIAGRHLPGEPAGSGQQRRRRCHRGT